MEHVQTKSAQSRGGTTMYDQMLFGEPTLPQPYYPLLMNRNNETVAFERGRT